MTAALAFPLTNVVGAGTATATPTTQTQAAGAVPSAAFTVLTVANASDAVTLPRGLPGQILCLKGGANAAKLFPPVGGKINNGTVDASFTLAATVATLVFYVTEIDAVAIQGAA